MKKTTTLTNKNFWILIIGLALISCTNRPKVIEEDVTDDKGTYEFSVSNVAEMNKINKESGRPAPSNVLHKVVVHEALPTARYVYLRVSEGSETYWLATKKTDVTIGATYYYKNGLLKTNFASKEYNRTFDKLYLVASLVPENHGHAQPQQKDIEMHAFEGDAKLSAMDTKDQESSSDVISIAQLVQNKTKWAGKRVKLSGKCTKINPKIMGRNWIHLKDGSMDKYDLVITSKNEIPVGSQVTMIGTVALNKDFGSGYNYELLVENGVLSKN